MKAWAQLLEPGPALATICLVLMVSAQAYAAPTLPDEHEQSTEIEYYPVADATGCYYNFQHYDEGDRIITNEPCLNCTCHNQMLMCYLRVCPFTKAIGANCKVEKRADQCCPVITCPEVPVQLVTSTAPSTALGHLNEYGCSIDNLFYSDGARVPSNPENPCELCYCIRNKTACVMQECTLNVDGCTPVFQEGVCCPVRYNCEHPDYLEGPTTPQISTTTSTTTVPPTTTIQSIECFFKGQSYNDGELVKKDIPCERCYCLKGDIVCAVQECGPTPLDKVNCTALPISEGQCCPDTYDCAGVIEEELTTLSSVSYEPEPTTLSTKDLEVTQGPLTTASQEDIEERKKFEGATEVTEIQEAVTKSATAASSEQAITEDQRPHEGQQLIGEEGETTELETHAPELIEEITRQSVEAHKPADQATEIPSEHTTRTALEGTTAGIQEVTEAIKATEISETEQVTRVGVETETTEKERVTFVPAISPEEITKPSEEGGKPSEERTYKPFFEEEMAKTTESPIESFTSRVSEAIESITSRVTDAVEAITTAITGSSSEEPATKIPEETYYIVTEQPKEGEQPGKEEVTEQPRESEKETAGPEEEPTTRVIAVTEKEPSFSTHPSATEQTDVESDKMRVTAAISEKEIPGKTSEPSEEEKISITEPSVPEKEKSETSYGTEESVKGPESETIQPAEKIPTTVSPEKEQPEQKPVAHDGEGIEEEHETKEPMVETENPSAIVESATLTQPQEEITKSQQSTTETTEASKFPEGPKPTKEAPESDTESVGAVTPTPVTEKEPSVKVPEEEQDMVKESEISTEPSEGEPTEPTLVTKPEKEQLPVIEEAIVPQDCEQQGCTKIPAETLHRTEQTIEAGTSQTPPPKTAPEQTIFEQTTLSAEQKPETDKALPSEKSEQPEDQEVTEQSGKVSTEKEEVVIVTEIPTKKTELPESMDHVSETVHPTKAPEQEQTENIELEPSTIRPEVSKVSEQESTKQPAYSEKESESPEKEHETQSSKVPFATEKIQPEHYYPTEASSESQTEQLTEETQFTKGPGYSKEPSDTEAQTQQALDESEATESTGKKETSATEPPKPEEGEQESDADVTKPVTEDSAESTESSSAKVTQSTSELPREEENEIKHEEPYATVPKTEGGEIKTPEEQSTTEVFIPDEGITEKKVTTHGKPETEEQITEKAIIPEVCTSESECVPSAVSSLPEAETESSKVPEEPTSQSSVKPEKEQEISVPGGTTESNKIPETEEHTEETNKIPEGSTEEVPLATGKPGDVLPHTEESSGEKPKEVPPSIGEGSGYEPEEGSGFTEATPEETRATEPVPRTEVTKEPGEQPEPTTKTEEGGKEPEKISGSEEPQPQEISTEGQIYEQPKTEPTPEIKPTEYFETTEYPEDTELPEREIPGEGSCLVDGQTYKNNSSVPPINHCQTSCKCVSSILRCESIECTPPPAGMQNCMPIFISPDSCCPTYSCTGPETTSPMESDSHVIQTTTPLSKGPATEKVADVEETEIPEVAITTIATMAKEPVQETKSPEKAAETEKGGLTDETATEKMSASTEFPVKSEETTIQDQIIEEPIITKYCDESGCKPLSVHPVEKSTEQAPKEGTESTEMSVTATSTEAKIFKEPQPEEEITPSKPEEGQLDQVTEAKLPEEDHATTIKPIIKPEQETSIPESTSQPSKEFKPSDRITLEPEEVTQTSKEDEGGQPTEAEIDKPKEVRPTEITTESPEPQEEETVKPGYEQPELPEIVTEFDKYFDGLPTEIAETPIVSTEVPEMSSISYYGVSETSTEFEGDVTEGPEIVTQKEKKPEFAEHATKQPEQSETSVTEEAPVVTTVETKSKLPLEETSEQPSRKPEIIEPESTTIAEEPKRPSGTTALPEKDHTPEADTEFDKLEKTTKPYSGAEEEKTTEQPKKVEDKTEQEPPITKQPEILEPGTTEIPSLVSKQPEGVQQATTQPTDIQPTTEVSEKTQEGQDITKESTESPVTEQESENESKVKQPHTTAIVPKEEEEPVEHITMPPESESTGKIIESESHVTGQESNETTSPKAVEEKSTEKSTVSPLSKVPVQKPEETGKTTQLPSEEGKIVTEIPKVSRPLEEAGKPEIGIPTSTEGATDKPVLMEEHIPTTTDSEEHGKVTEPEITITEGLLEDGSKKPAPEDKVTVEEQTEVPDTTKETPVELSVTDQYSISPYEAEKTPEIPLRETTLPDVDIISSPQTEMTPEETTEEATVVTIAATQRASAEPSTTEKAELESPGTEKVPEEIPEKATEVPSVEVISAVSETEKPSATEAPSVTDKSLEEPSDTEKIPEELVTLRPSEVSEMPSTEDNEIPEKETSSVSERGSESTEGPTKEAEHPLKKDEEATKELEKETEAIILPEEGQTKAPEEQASTLSSSEQTSSVASVEEERASEQPSKEGDHTTLEPEKEIPISSETDKPSIDETEKTTTEKKPLDETFVSGTKRPIISEEKGITSTSEQPTAGETEVPSVPEEEGKTSTAKQPIVDQTEQPSFSEEESKTSTPKGPISQETEKSSLLEKEQTSRPELSVHETKKPGESEESKTTTSQETFSSTTEKPSIPEDEIRTPVSPEQAVGETTKPTVAEEENTPVPDQSTLYTEKPEEEIKTPTSKEPIVFPDEEAVTRKQVEESPVFISPEVTTSIAEEKGTASIPERGAELFTSGPKVETSTRPHVPGELSTSAPVSEVTTILPATTTESSPAHIPGELVPEPPEYEQPGDEYEDEEQNAFGPGTCRYGGKVYVSAQQIPRDDPCDFCFCFRSDIICLQQSCPPPIPRCHEEPIRGFCCPRYECPVSMATAVNVTTSTTTTTTMLPPHFLTHAYKGRAAKTGCQISGKAYRVGEAIRATSGPCLHCTCGGDGQMKCDPKPCSPEPMLRQMIAAAASRRRR